MVFMWALLFVYSVFNDIISIAVSFWLIVAVYRILFQ